MWLEDKEDEEEEELPTYLSSTLTEAQVLSILSKSKMEMISPRTSFQNKPVHPFPKICNLSAPSKIISDPPRFR